jgi:Uncharacterized protein conserved in bacteria
MSEKYENYLTLLYSLKREAFIPKIDIEAEASEKGSRYFGAPWMPTDMEWPYDGDIPMNFVLQLDLATVPWRPEGMPNKGLLLFFHAEEYNEPDLQSLLVVVDSEGEGGLRNPPVAQGVYVNPALPISGWQKTVDTPSYESRYDIEGLADEDFEHIEDGCYHDEQRGLELILGEDGSGYDENQLVQTDTLPVSHTFAGDKIGGWPFWEQGDDTPEDEDGNRWAYFMQVGYAGIRGVSLDKVAIDWPTWGTGHIYFHEGEFLYVWACD